MLLAVTNESTKFTATDLDKAVSACDTQMKLHLAPVWEMIPAPIVVFEDTRRIPADADILTILDDSDQAGFLGYHRMTPDGRPYSRVFVNPILNHGGEMLTTSLSVSTVMSHEICEWFIDRLLNLWADGPEGQYPLEVCDPVADDTYETNGVSVSNFVYKRFFDARAPATCQFDHLNRLKAPFTVSSGGQIQVRKNGKVQATYGGFVPQWKKSLKEFPASRSYRRRGTS